MPIDNLSSNSKHYVGKPCSKCGSTIRSLKFNYCVLCHRSLNKEYVKKNFETTQKYLKKWYSKNANKVKRKSAAWQCANRERYNFLARTRRDPEKESVRNREYRKTPNGRITHQISTINNIAKRKQAEGSHTITEWIELKQKYNNRCLCCGINELELTTRSHHRVLEQDHIVPITKGGSNWITNIQPLCNECNGPHGKWQEINDFRRTPHPFCINI